MWVKTHIYIWFARKTPNLSMHYLLEHIYQDIRGSVKNNRVDTYLLRRLTYTSQIWHMYAMSSPASEYAIYKTMHSIYEGWSKSSDRYLVALSRDIFERHTMHHSNEQGLTFIMVLIISRCNVSFNNYSTLYMVHSIPLACFHVIEL